MEADQRAVVSPLARTSPRRLHHCFTTRSEGDRQSERMVRPRQRNSGERHERTSRAQKSSSGPAAPHPGGRAHRQGCIASTCDVGVGIGRSRQLRPSAWPSRVLPCWRSPGRECRCRHAEEDRTDARSVAHQGARAGPGRGADDPVGCSGDRFCRRDRRASAAPPAASLPVRARDHGRGGNRRWVGGFVVLTVAPLPDDGAVPAIAFGIVAWFLVVVVGSRSSTFWTPR